MAEIARLREAWVDARYGAWEAAEWGAGAAGRIDQDDRARLRRAVARYERNTQARPEGYPAAGLAALMHLGEFAGAGGGPRTLRYAIGALDQLSRRMRAVHSSADPQRVQRSIRLAAARHQPDERTPLVFRLPGPRWPRWVKLTPNGAPLIIDGELQVHADWAPTAGSDAYRSVARDAHLLDCGWLPLDLDGRAAMRANASTYDPATGTRRAMPGPYPAPEQRPRTQTDRDILELAHHSGSRATRPSASLRLSARRCSPRSARRTPGACAPNALTSRAGSPNSLTNRAPTVATTTRRCATARPRRQRRPR